MLNRLREFFSPSTRAINAWLESWQLSQLTRWQRRRLQRRLQRQLGYWRRWATSPDSRGRFSRIGWQLVPRILGAAQKYTDLNSTNASDRVRLAGSEAAHQLSDGTLVLIDYDGTSAYLKYSSDHSTISTIATLSGTDFLLGSDVLDFCVNSSDDIFVVGTDPTTQAKCVVKAFTKGGGYTWTAQTTLTAAAALTGVFANGIAALWCNTTGGTNSKGHLLVIYNGNTATAYAICDAGAALAGSGTLVTNQGNSPTFLTRGPLQSSPSIAMAADGFGGTAGVSAITNSSTTVTVGSWAVSSAGALSTNTTLTQLTSGSQGSPNKIRVLNYATNAFAIVYQSTTTNTHYMVATYSKTAQLHAGVDSGTPANLPLNAQNLGWDAFNDPATANQIWVIALAAVSGGNQQVYRISCALGSGTPTWAASVTSDDLLTGINTTGADLRAVAQPRAGGYVDWQVFAKVSSTNWALLGDYTTLDSGPSAPTLSTPANGGVADLAAGGVIFGWVYNHPQGIGQAAWALRIKVSGGSYNYVRASDNTLQSTIVWNSGSATSYSMPAGLLSDGATVYNWSVATQDNLGLQGAFASDFTVTGDSPPAVAITSPSGSVVSATPEIDWTFTPGTGGNTQLNYQIRVEHGSYGTTPGSGTQDWDSGVITDSVARAKTVGVSLANATTFRAFLRCTESNGLVSSWVYSTFTTAFDVPAPPLLVASYDAVLDRIALTLNGLDNLLTANQASIETDASGWDASGNCAIAQSATFALDGSDSLRLTSIASGDMIVETHPNSGGTSAIACKPSTAYTAMAWFRAAASARSCQIRLYWYQANGAASAHANDTSSSMADAVGSWTQLAFTVTSPADAAYVLVDLRVLATGAASEVHYIDEIGLFPGTPAPTTILSDDFEVAGGTQTLFRSIGTDATGTLNAWSLDSGVPTIASNVVTMPTGSGMSAGHLDWDDCTVYYRFKWNTGNIWRFDCHYVDGNNFIYVNADGTNLSLGKKVGGTFTGIQASAAALVNGTQYWLQLTASGTTYTAKIFADNAGAINLGSQVGSTATGTALDSQIQRGRIAVLNVDGGTGTHQFGGAFANVCQVTGPTPVNWTATASGGEPAFAWSSQRSHSGTKSLSIYAAHSSAGGWWVYNTPARGLAITYSGWMWGSGNPLSIGFGDDGNDPRAYLTIADSTWRFVQSTSIGGGSPMFLLAGGSGTTGTYYLDVALVTRPTWTRGGLVGGQTFYLYSSDDGGVTWQLVRGGNVVVPAAGPAQLASAYDYEAVPRAARQYRAFTTASSGALLSVASNVVSVTPVPSSFWLKYPLNPALNMAINVDPPLPHSRPEMTTSFPVLGGTKMLVGADTLLGHQNAGLTCHVNSLAQWISLQALLVTQDVLLLESPFGEHWYVRIGSAGGSGGGSHRSYELHGPDYSDANSQYRKVTFPYVEVAAPATP